MALSIVTTTRREPAVISISLLSAVVEEEERRTHTNADVDYSGYKPTPLREVPAVRLSYKSACRW